MEPLTLPRKELNQFKAKLNPKITNLASSGHPIQTSQSARPNRPPPHGEQKSTAAGKKGMGGRRDARTLPPKEMRSTSTDRAEPPESPIPAAAAADRTGAAVEVAWHRLPSSPLLPPPVSPTTPSFSLQEFRMLRPPLAFFTPRRRSRPSLYEGPKLSDLAHQLSNCVTWPIDKGFSNRK